MGNYIAIILSAVVSLIVASITGWITSKFAFKSEVKKNLHLKKESLYSNLCDDLDMIIMDTKIIYDDEYKKKLLSYKSTVKLIATKDIIKDYKEILDFISDNRKSLRAYDNKINPYLDNNFEDLAKDGDVHINPPEFILEDYHKQIDVFKNKNAKANKSEMNKKINNTIDKMRKDLGNSKGVFF